MKSFLNACGIKDSLRLVVEGPEAKGGELADGSPSRSW